METEHLFAQSFLAMYPEEAAAELERLPPADVAALLADAPPEIAAMVLRRMSPFSAATCLTSFAVESTSPILTALPLDSAALLLRRLEPSSQEHLLANLSSDVAPPLRLLLHYPEGSAGALMDPRALALPEDIPVRDALERVRQIPQHVLYYLYVVNREQKLVGVLNLRELMLALPTALLHAVMRPHVARIVAGADRAAIVSHAAWRDIHALPVVDDGGVFLGVLRYETLRRLEDESAANRQTQNAVATLLSVGELYWTGLSYVLAGLTAALMPPTTRQDRGQGTDHDA